MTINGPGANVLTISGNNSRRVFNIVSGPYDVNLSGLTIANGWDFSGGGGIFNFSKGTVTVTNSTLSVNSATSTSPHRSDGHRQGGGIYSNGTVTERQLPVDAKIRLMLARLA